MVSFWADRWQHVIFSADELRLEGKCPVIQHLCYGPLETLEYGVLDGEFYFENKVLEGIDEGSSFFEKIDKQHFGGVLENERRLCEKYAPQLLEQVTKRLEEVCGKLELGRIKESETPS